MTPTNDMRREDEEAPLIAGVASPAPRRYAAKVLVGLAFVACAVVGAVATRVGHKTLGRVAAAIQRLEERAGPRERASP